MRAESYGAAAASLALGAVLVVSSLSAGRLLLEPPDDVERPVVATGRAFDTVDVAHLLETESRPADAPREPALSTPEATPGGPGSGISEPRSPALAEVGTEADDDPADESGAGAPRPAPQASPQPAAPRQPADAERPTEPPAPAPRIRALSGSSGSTQLVVEPDRSARKGPSTRGDRAPRRTRARDGSPRAAAPSAERTTPERAVESPAADDAVPADAREPVEQGAETADERVRSASLEASRPGPRAGEPTTEDHGADSPRVGARDGEEAETEKAQPEKAEAEKTQAEKAERAEPQPPHAASGKPEPGTSGPQQRQTDPPTAEPATPATPAEPASDRAVGRGSADEATDA